MFDMLSPHGIIAAALTAPPGPDVLAALAGVEVKPLSEYLKVDLLIALDRQRCWLDALIQPAIAAVGDAVQAQLEAERSPGDPLNLGERAAHAEIAAALRLPDTVAGSTLAMARELTTDLSAVPQALAAGQISALHAKAIIDATYPLSRDHALAADGRWRRMILDPQTGDLLDLGHSSYQPTAALARFVKTRDRTCTFPSCPRTADHGDTDHARPYRPNTPGGGRTDKANLHPPCKNHHVLKHKGRWTLPTHPTTGLRTWTSPTGHTYPIEPIDHRSEPATVDPTPKPPAAHDVSNVCPF